MLDLSKLDEFFDEWFEVNFEVTEFLDQAPREFKAFVDNIRKQRDAMNATKSRLKRGGRKCQVLEPISEENDENDNASKFNCPRQVTALKRKQITRPKNNKRGKKVADDNVVKGGRLINDEKVKDSSQTDVEIDDMTVVKHNKTRSLKKVEDKYEKLQGIEEAYIQDVSVAINLERSENKIETKSVDDPAAEEVLVMSELKTSAQNIDDSTKNKAAVILSPTINISSLESCNEDSPISHPVDKLKDTTLQNDKNKVPEVESKTNDSMFKRPLPEEFNHGSPNNVAAVKRVTRSSKMAKRDNVAKQDIKKTSPEVNSSISSSDHTPQKRVTRSKIVNKNKDKPDIKASYRDDSPDKDNKSSSDVSPLSEISEDSPNRVLQVQKAAASLNDGNKKTEIESKASDSMFKRPLPEEFNHASPNNVGTTIRVTRSKMAKRDNAGKQNTKITSVEVSTISSSDCTPEDRVILSKAVKNNKNVFHIKTSPEIISSPEPDLQRSPPQSAIARNLPRSKIQDFTANPNAFPNAFKSIEKLQTKCTPLQVRNALYTTTKSKIPLSSETASRNKCIIGDAERKKREEEVQRKRLKEEEALRKREIMMKAKQEEIRKKNEEKMLKVAANKEAAKRGKYELVLRLEREREKMEKAAKELERKKDEETLKKKRIQQQKILEAESRRTKEEAARQAKFREMEEEQKREEEIRRKQQEETEKIQRQRIEEIRKNEAAMKAKEMEKKQQANVAIKDADNYDINLDDTEDDDEDDIPEIQIPHWAQKEHRRKQDLVHAHIPHEVIHRYYCCPSQSPDITEFFGKLTLKRVRTSSAVWASDTLPLSKP